MSSLINKFDSHYSGASPSRISRDTLACTLLLYSTYKLGSLVHKHGFIGIKKLLMKNIFSVMSVMPGTSSIIENEKKNALNMLSSLFDSNELANEPKTIKLPDNGIEQDKLYNLLKSWKNKEEKHWASGQVSGSIFHGEHSYSEFLTSIYGLFAMTNPLQSDVFPFIIKMESEIIQCTINIFNGPSTACGVVTSGGTESILMAMKAYRDRCIKLNKLSENEKPEIIACVSAHAAFDKAANYFNMNLIKINQNPLTFKMEIKDIIGKINKKTAVIIGSAPQFAQGVCDDIPELSDIAIKYNIPLHVDCCLGGFLLPFLRDLNLFTMPFDFSLPGVSSISADTHKYGYAPKGSSVVMYRNFELRSYQFFVAAEWTGGIYASPSMPGSRPGGLIAACWAALMSQGLNGYKNLAQQIRNTAISIEKGIKTIAGLRIMGKPEMSVVAFTVDENSNLANKLNIYRIGAAMSEPGRDWHLNSLQNPPGIHLVCTKLHIGKENKFIQDLKDSVEHVIKDPMRFATKGTAGVYGMTAQLPDTSLIDELAKAFLGEVLKPK